MSGSVVVAFGVVDLILSEGKGLTHLSEPGLSQVGIPFCVRRAFVVARVMRQHG
jgi:hypothetical protein